MSCCNGSYQTMLFFALISFETISAKEKLFSQNVKLTKPRCELIKARVCIILACT